MSTKMLSFTALSVLIASSVSGSALANGFGFECFSMNPDLKAYVVGHFEEYINRHGDGKIGFRVSLVESNQVVEKLQRIGEAKTWDGRSAQYPLDASDDTDVVANFNIWSLDYQSSFVAVSGQRIELTCQLSGADDIPFPTPDPTPDPNKCPNPHGC